MGSANFTIPLVVQSPGNVIYSSEMNAEFQNISTNFNPAGMSGYQDSLAQKQLQEDPATGLTTSLAKDLEQIRFAVKRLARTTYWYDTPADPVGSVPIGSIIPFYDFSAALTFDTNYWVYCDGQSATVGGVSRTLPDLSGRYLVGFGTPNGGGDIDTATWATTAVGQTSHTSASIAHTHTGPSHTHLVGQHYDPGFGGLRFFKSTYGGGDYVTYNEAALCVAGAGLSSFNTTVTGSVSNGDDFTSAAGGTGNTGSSLTTISIQPESIRVRFIMRKA